MPADLSFSLKQARRMALAAQGFSGRKPPAQVKAVQVNRLIERLGVLQIDSVNAVVRSHYLPLFSRLGSYSPLLLEQAAWSQGRRRTLFEYWGHEASLLPMALYPLMRYAACVRGARDLSADGAFWTRATGHHPPGIGYCRAAGRVGGWQPVDP